MVLCLLFSVFSLSEAILPFQTPRFPYIYFNNALESRIELNQKLGPRCHDFSHLTLYQPSPIQAKGEMRFNFGATVLVVL